jgi:phytoene desaturase
MRVVVVGAGVGGLACAIRLVETGHEVTVVEATGVAGGKAGRREAGRFAWDSGPSLLTMPHVVEDLLGPDELELLPVEPVTRYRWADGTSVDMPGDPPRARAALDAWSPGAGDDWLRFLRVCTAMWSASAPFLEGAPPWPPRLDADPPDPRALLAVRPWHTLRSLARATVRDPRLRLVVERFATYAGADPRRAPAALALAGYVEHRWGAWQPRGGISAIVTALVRRLEAAGGELRLHWPVSRILRSGRRASAVEGPAGRLALDALVSDVDALALGRLLGRRRRRVPERSLSGLAVMLGLRGTTPSLVHHEIRFPADYDAEFDDVFAHRRPVRDPTLYVSTPAATEGGPEATFVLVNAPSGVEADWDAEAEKVVDRLGVRDRVEAMSVRSPPDLETESGAVDGAIYGTAPHGRLGTLKRPGPRVRGVENLRAIGGTVHPGGGLPLVMLGAAAVAREIGPESRPTFPRR